ncbi:MAG: SMP-30/gluconolactonase/LRE family protein [Tabrizicola sp.]|nr:SMP-30/gluconolactonase/LRE family protein [Tabrizicola sp.]
MRESPDLSLIKGAKGGGISMRICLTSVMSFGLSTAALAGDVTVLDPAAFFPEGPVVVEGKLFYAQYSGNVVSVWDGAVKTDIWKAEGCGPSAVVPVGENFGITCYDNGKLEVIGRDGGSVASYDKDAAGGALLGPNDGTPDGRGGAWFTLSGPWTPGPVVGRIVHLAADGTLTEVANDLNYPNGIVLGPDGRLYVNESYAGTVTSFAVAEDGSLSDRASFVHLYQMGEDPGVFPDGIKVGPNGNFFIGLNSAPAIIEVIPDGSKVVARHLFETQGTPNMAFSADGATMYVMAVDNEAGAPYEGRVLSMPLK